jgi:hypothetical protein
MHDYEYIVQLLYSLIETLELYQNMNNTIIHVILIIKTVALTITAFNLYKIYKK